jgi:hypothetical protein
VLPRWLFRHAGEVTAVPSDSNKLIPTALPAAPGDLRGWGADAGTIDVAWNPVRRNDWNEHREVAGYTVEATNQGTHAVTTFTKPTAYAHLTGLPGESYSVRVQAAGGAWSSPLSVYVH